MAKLLIIFFTLLTGFAQASKIPIVVGYKILLPQEGSFQIERLPEHQVMCVDTTECTVPVGLYQIRNIANGQQWDNVKVTDNTSEDGINVEEHPHTDWQGLTSHQRSQLAGFNCVP